MHSFCEYFEKVVYMFTTVLCSVSGIKKIVSFTERGTFFMSVVRLVSKFTGTQMPVSCALWWEKSEVYNGVLQIQKKDFCFGYVTLK